MELPYISPYHAQIKQSYLDLKIIFDKKCYLIKIIIFIFLILPTISNDNNNNRNKNICEIPNLILIPNKIILKENSS